MARRLFALSMLLMWQAAAGGRHSYARASEPASEPHQGGSDAVQGADCTTPYRQSGRCIRLQTCRPLLDLLKTTSRSGGLPNVEVTQLLRRSHCGFQGSSVMVCCPIETPRVKPETSSERPDFANAYPDEGPAMLSFSAPAASAPASTRPPPPPSSAAHKRPVPEDADYGYGSPPITLSSGNLPVMQPMDEYPAENLALLPIEVCGMAFGQKHSPNGNLSALMQYPWMARIGYRQGERDDVEYLCTGSLISERYVLTAAHCIGVRNGPVTVRLGEWDTATDPDCVDAACAPPVLDVAVEDTLKHDEYSRGVNDIALIRLARPVAFSEAVSPICLPIPVRNRPEEEPTGRHMAVAAWGHTSPYRRHNAPSRRLLTHRVPVVGPAECHAAYDTLEDVNFDTEKQLCVGGGCHGDSGSPLVLSEPSSESERDLRAVLHGVLAYGVPDCALRKAPVAYTRVSRFVPWLLRNLRPNPFVPKDRSSGSGLVDPRGAGRAPRH